MADFPAIEPTNRSYDFGEFAMSDVNAFAGGSMRFLHADDPLGQGLTLEYQEISQADMDTIRSHYQGQQGGYLSFLLPAIIWQGHLSATTIVPAGARWKYADVLEEEHLQGKLYNVTVSLRYVGTTAVA